ncbi:MULTISPECIES: GAF domain-containing protein [Amycolatopsis]|uniref:GAF domain-containing protein n=2 Tax=Amycolatopsis TaxID=1813 RepID=A0A1I3YIP9_9PSEU|nr:GAF domain-containing protein [Amycolatopsis sacchari]SFK31670.1 GAF domain-containing protein [Amycolatopsis sacchari]
MNLDNIEDRLLAAPRDPEVQARMERLRALGIGTEPDPDFDAFAAKLAQITGAPFAMVNFINDREQYFAGLFTPSSTQRGAALQAAQASEHAGVSRTMGLDHGFCPHVVVRRKALVLDDVCDYPRFVGNPVIDKLGIRTYLGAPLIDRTGTALGTICVIDTQPRSWGRAGLNTIKGLANELVEQLNRRPQR